VAGSFNDWDPDALALAGPDPDGTFTARVVLARGTYQYKYVLDGQDWRSDPRNIHQVGPDHDSVVWVGTR
jgi:1,4-alpha-glucan branching enzyme